MLRGQARERIRTFTAAAIALGRRARARTRHSPADAKVYFSIPLAAKTDDADWERRCRLLGQTLRSILNQTDPDFDVIIAGHERPSINELDDTRITFLECNFDKIKNISESRADKRRKRLTIALHVAKQGGGYIAWTDADDLVSKNLVQYVRMKADPNGYLIRMGYGLDHLSGTIAPVPGAWKCSFDQVCGSCAVVYFSAADIGPSYKMAKAGYYGMFRQHTKWGEVAAREGRPLHPVPFPAAVYVLNTFQNLSAIAREAGSEMLRNRVTRIHRHQVPLSAELAEEFSIALPPSMASGV